MLEVAADVTSAGGAGAAQSAAKRDLKTHSSITRAVPRIATKMPKTISATVKVPVVVWVARDVGVGSAAAGSGTLDMACWGPGGAGKLPLGDEGGTPWIEPRCILTM